MNYSKKEIILSVALCLLPILLGLYWWEELPDMIPTHFDLNNQPNGWSSKPFAVFGLPAFMAAADALCIFALRSDPKHKRQSVVLQRVMLWFIPALSCGLMLITLLVALGYEIDLTFYISLFIGITFMVIGNYLPKCRQNYTMGIRLPWTLNDEDNWNYTHRIGGFSWTAGGALVILFALLGLAGLILAVLLISTAIPMVASYLYYRRKKGAN